MLTGKVAIVTGAGRGLGLAMAQALAAAGAAVVVNDLDEDTAEAAADTLRAAGGQAVAHACAVGSTEAADSLVAAALAAFGRLDILLTNAGNLRDKVLWNLSDDDFDSVVHTHLRGTFTCARAAVRHLRQAGHGGRLILVGSPAGQRGNAGQTAYAAAKAGIAAFARTWAQECARAGITVNAMVPAALTRMVATVPALAPWAAAMDRGEPLPAALRQGLGMGTPADVAPLAVFLASDAAAAVTGQCIGIGGDRLALWSHPQEISSATWPGGWTAEAITHLWPHTVGRRLEDFGLPPLSIEHNHNPETPAS